MKGENLPYTDHVIRYVPWTKLLRDEDSNVRGVLHIALELRDGEKALSATWVEFFDGTPTDQFNAAVQAIRGSINAKPRAGMAKANVGLLHELSARHKAKIRVVHEPSRSNEAHVGIRRVPQDNTELLDLLAVEAFVDVVLNNQIP